MTKRKKLTMKEAEERINILAYNLNTMRAAVDSIGIAFTNYIRFKGDEADFKKHLESMQNVNKLKESVQNDTK